MVTTTEIIFAVLLFSLEVPVLVDGQCTLPFSDGTWLSSTRGTWTVAGSGTQLQGFTAALTVSLSTADLNCTQVGSTSTQYVLSTYFEIFTGLFITVYTCLDIQPTAQAPASYVTYIVTPIDESTGEKFTSDLNSVCTNTGYATPLNVIMVVQSGSESSAAANCPDVILGNYTVSYSDSDSVTSSVEMDSCNDTTLMNFSNVTAGSNIGFTSGNLLQCLYYAASGSNVYVFTYNNNDTSVDSSTTYRFTCWVFAYTSTGTSGTVHPESCLADQSSTSVAYPGQQMDFTPYYVCPLNSADEEKAGLAGWAIALIVLAILLVLVIVGLIIAYLLFKRHRRRADEENEGIIKDRQPSPVDIPDEDAYIAYMKKKLKEDQIRFESRDPKYRIHRKKEDGYDSGFDEKGQLKDKLPREHSFELHEIKKGKGKGKKLQASKPRDDSTDTVNTVGTTTTSVDEQPKSSKEPVKPASTTNSTVKPASTTNSTVKPASITNNTVAEQKKKGKEIVKPVGTTNATVDEQRKPPIGEEEPVIIPLPIGKRSIGPTTPRPDANDTALLRIKKERERREKEKQDKKKQEEAKKGKGKETKPQIVEIKEEAVIKTVREDSSGEEYETDESEKEERMKKLLEKRKRLQGAAYEPPDGVTDAKVVGKRKDRRHGEEEDGGDMTKSLVSREEQERRDNVKKSQKRAMRKHARRKLHPSQEHPDSSDSDTDTGAKKHKRRKAGGRGAPYMEQYHTKKGIEKGLDDIDYWNENTAKPADSIDDMVLEGHPQPLEVVPADQNTELLTKDGEGMDEDWDKNIPDIGIEIGQNGQLPEGYYRDNGGNIVRESDGAIIATADIVKQIEMRRRMNVFGLPRLKRNDDGRPLGGYKDDIFGPTAEWDWGEPDELDDKKSEIQRATSGKQVGFTVADGNSVAPTPLAEYDYNQLKGRQLGPAERELLQQRLFEQQKQKTDGEGDKRLPVHFLGKRPCAYPGSVYLDNCQVESLQPNNVAKRSKSMRSSTPGGSAMFMRSDTFDDGRQHSKENRRQPTSGMKRNTKFRSSWSASDSFVKDGIPEEVEMEDTESAPRALEMRRNIGSEEEFIVVPGDKDPFHHRDRFGYPPAREETLMSDISMKTAPDSIRPFSGDDQRYRKYLGELYKDQKYFQYYLDTEKLQTRAGKETRGLAHHGLDFLKERASYWNELDPPYHPPPSELALRLSRMQTLYTIADSGMDSAMSSDLGRPNSADDVDPNITSSRLSKRENTREISGRGLVTSNRSDLSQPKPERDPPTGRSDATKTPSKFEKSGTSVTLEPDVTGSSESKSGQTKHNPKKRDKEKKSKSSPKDTNDKNVLTLQQLDQDI